MRHTNSYADGKSTATRRTASATPTASPTCTPGGQITTLFASNNFGNPGGANYFDVTVAANPITVTSLDINTAETVAFSNVQVYVLPGMTSVGNETNMALWTLVATGSGTGAGVDLPTHVTLSNPIRPKRGHPLRNRCGGRPRNYAPLHQRQWIESKLFQCGPVPCPRIRHQRAVHRAGLLASRLEWDDLLQWRSLRRQSNSNSNAYSDGQLHAKFVPRAHRLCRYRRAYAVAERDLGRARCGGG